MSYKKIISLLLLTITVAGCVQVNGPEKKKSKSQQADVHYKLATAQLQANNPTLALKELLVAVDLDPDNSAIQVALAQAYQQKKAYALAENHYFKALELSDNDPRYQNNLATLYLDMQEWDKAITYFDKAASNLLFLRPHIAIAGKAYAYYKKQDYAQALTYYKEVTNLAPGYAPAYYLQSEVYRAMGEREMERILLEHTIERSPQFLQARYRLAELYIEDGANDDARQELKTILEVAPASELGLQAKSKLKTIADK